MKIICITQVKHLKGIARHLESFGTVDYFEETSKDNLIKIMSENTYDVIFCNPNKQRFILNEDILSNHKGKTILTASTGLNHIDVKYCESNNIKVLSLTKDYDLINDLPFIPSTFLSSSTTSSTALTS